MTMGRFFANILSLLSSDVLNRTTTFALYALVARYAGAEEFGQLSLALTLCYVFQVLAAGGLRTLITREIARAPAQTTAFVVRGSVAASICGIGAAAGQVLVAVLLGYSAQTVQVLAMLALGLVPYALAQVAEAAFQGRERMDFIARANVPANLAKLALVWVLVTGGAGVTALASVIAGTHLMVLVLDWYYLRRLVDRSDIRLSLEGIGALWHQTLPFLGMDGIIAVYGSLNAILLSKLASEVDVGLYNAANQVLVPTNILLINLVLSVFPLIVRRFDLGTQLVHHIYEALGEFVLFIALLSAVGLFLLAEPILLLLYGQDDFSRSSEALRIMAWGLMPVAMSHVLGHVQLAGLGERTTLRIVAINMVISLAVGLVLIPGLGLRGAALAALVSQVASFGQHYLTVRRLVPGLALATIVWRPALAGTIMALCFLLVAPHYGSWAGVLGAIGMYVGAWLALLACSGGVHRLRALYLHPPTEGGAP